MSPDYGRRPLLRVLTACGLAIAVGSAAGCKVTSADVDTWKGTRKGPGKMVAVMLADKFEMPLRTYAALELVEMERQDVDGVAEMQRAIQALEPETRGEIVRALADGLIELMQKPAAKPSPDGAPPPHQVRAKDAAFLLVSSANPEVREKLTRAIVSWYAADFNGRSLSGNFSAEQVVRGLGASAAKSLVDALNAKLPQQALVKLAELIGQIGDPETRQKAGQRLVAIEREMEGAEFSTWLKSQIADQMKAANQKVDNARVEKAAELNRENFISNGALPAMKYVADLAEVSSRLLEIASSKKTSEDRRTRALQALEGKVGPQNLDEVLALALDASNPVSVRDYAFDRVGDIRSPKALPSLWPLVQNGDDQRLRWRAGELVLAIGGPSVLDEFFTKIAQGSGFPPEELDGYAQRMAQMTPPPREAALAQLHAADWWKNVVALDYFQRKGTEADIADMTPLTKNATPVKGKGWDKNDTVGKVAERAIAGLRDRLKEAAGTAAATK